MLGSELLAADATADGGNDADGLDGSDGGAPPPSDANSNGASVPSKCEDGGCSVTAISSTYYFSCALRTDGTIRCWGADLPSDPPSDTVVVHSTATPVAAPAKIVSMRVGPSLIAATFDDGRAAYVGPIYENPGGTGWTFVDMPTDVVAVSPGTSHLCLLGSDRTVSCLGGNANGQLGREDPFASSTARVPGVTNVVALSAGESATCAAIDDGSVTCWGTDYEGVARGPHKVEGVAGAVGVSLTWGGGCAIINDGTVRCWGHRDGLGDGSTQDRKSAGPVDGIQTARSIASGNYGTCAALTDGTVWCWGILDDHTQLRPVKFDGASATIAVSMGQNFHCLLQQFGNVQCWGSNNGFGQLGNGMPTPTGIFPTPVDVLGLE